MRDIVELLGVPADAIVLQSESRNTYEDGLYSYELLSERGINRILLVTSAMHMPRSVAIFENQGFEVIPAPTDYTVSQDNLDNLTWHNPEGLLIGMVPSSGNVGMTTNTIKEYIGWLVYRLRGWL
jgi:uncharacterized SAM-binding protein YcdF (DUF218 family)